MENSTLFQKLKNILVSQFRSEEEILDVKKAFTLAAKYHEGQYRRSEEAYIIHPLEVACILADLQADKETIIAALLHDILEDTDAPPELIKENFGESVLNLVQGVTKLGKFSFSSKEQRQAENFRKMFLAMANDVRIILLKLADRLHNMKTLHYMKPEKQKEISKETLEIFSPLANRLGMGKIKTEMDDLALNYLHPEKYIEIVRQVAQSRRSRETMVKTSIQIIEKRLKENEIKAEVYGRAKNYYSIFKKMTTQNKSFDELFDISALRIIVSNVKECYEVLGIIHSAFKPIPGRFKDYIAMPKSNGYRSLHTTVVCPNGRPLEVQIRTKEMHQIAEYGIAAHWKYKEAGSVRAEDKLDEKLSWLRQLVEFQQDVSDAKEYVDSVKLDLFRDEVFVFTPRGDVYDLPKGATPLDFAYRVHTEVGNTCTGALVNGKIVPLETTLKNGDIIEILTSKNAHPRLDWLNIVATSRTKSKIRTWFKKNKREEHIAQGKSLLESELGKSKAEDLLKSGMLLEIAKQLNYTQLEELYAALGYGELTLPKITNRIKKEEKDPAKEDEEVITSKPRYASGKNQQTKQHIEGLDDMLYHISKCCCPLPGENILGVITRSRGISIHKEDCKMLAKIPPERVMRINWSEKSQADATKTYPINFIVETFDRIGVFKDILSKIADQKVNVTYAGVKTRKDDTALIEITAEVASKDQFNALCRALYDVSDIVTVRRQTQFSDNNIKKQMTKQSHYTKHKNRKSKKN